MKNIKEITDIFKKEIKKKYTSQITMPIYMGVSDMEIILEEIERLNNLLKETSQTLSEQTIKAITLKSENEILNNIIKEVREKIKGVKKINNEVYKKTDMLERFYSRKWCNDEMNSFLEILDKENKLC